MKLFPSKDAEAEAPVDEREADLYAVSSLTAAALRGGMIHWLLVVDEKNIAALRVPAPGRVVALAAGNQGPSVVLKNGDLLRWDRPESRWLRLGNVFRPPSNAQ